MDVQVIWKQGEPDYAVLGWADYQQLLAEAGRDPQGRKQVAADSNAAVSLSRLRGLREARSMTLETLAREAGISPSYLQMIEAGEREPSAVLLRSLGRIFDVPAWDA
ncbi:MAG: helix-turn-helix transcriptional regulator [Thiopseudomonas sp.]